jgi:vacuolar-type H+-ATPase catalytic subunit A/Vma1
MAYYEDDIKNIYNGLDKYKSKNKSTSIFQSNFNTSDNQVAIEMLRNITEIINGVENDDAKYINSQLKKLKENINEFDELFRENLVNGMYYN